MTDPNTLEGIAVVGLAGRFPKAENVGQYWDNLISARDCFSDFSIDQIVSEGVPREVAERSNYVKRSPVIEDAKGFDNRVFRYSPKEAELIDPHQRIMLECAWEAMENAGYDPHRFPGLIGIWAGSGVNNYLLKNIISQGAFEDIVDFQTITSNDKDYLASRIAYNMNLRGPAVVVQTACSTSLVAVNMACLGLLTYQCDMALAGAAFLQTPRARGYLYREGEIFSPDGFCRSFDKDANGTVLGEGCGIVVLRRLEDAVADNDHIWAVIKGSAVNNDGANRAGYTAPGIQGQMELLTIAQTMAGIGPEEISYIEAHGTGTQLGDPIEVSALTQVFRRSTPEVGFCGIGSVKSNIGHLDVAAGIAGLIKTIYALKNRKLPPTINYKEPNPELRLSESPFYIVDKLTEWEPINGRRIAGVSSFGMGGTNAHIILEEYAAPVESLHSSDRKWQIFPMSAATPTALDRIGENLSGFLEGSTDIPLDDIAWTLATGRTQLRFRRCAVADLSEKAALRVTESKGLLSDEGEAEYGERPVVYLYSGQGAQYYKMAEELFLSEMVFRSSMEKCSELLGPVYEDAYLLDILYGKDEKLGSSVNQTAVSQPALFAIEYSLSRLLESYGVKPTALVGHSIGEYVAACEAGVFSLEDALMLVKKRGKILQSMPSGEMLTIFKPEDMVQEILPENVDIAVVNAPNITVVSAAMQDMADFELLLNEKNIKFRKLETSHGFHSRMMEAAALEFAEVVRNISAEKPRLPLGSNFTGDWMTDEQVSNPEYWSNHLRHTVRFGDNLNAIENRFTSPILLEVGPGNALSTIVQQQAGAISKYPVVTTVRHPRQQAPDQAFFLRALGSLWCHGVDVDLESLFPASRVSRTPLPSYPFERKKFWIDAAVSEAKDGKYGGDKGEQDDEDGSKKKEWPPKQRHYERPEIGSEYVAPMDESEKTLAAIWQNVLGIKKVGIKDSFFDLGGNSLIAAQIISRIRESFNCNMAIQSIFDTPTVEGLAKLINSIQPIDEANQIPPLEKIEKNEVFSLSLSQERLWFINKIEPFSPAYNIVQATKINGQLDERILQKAFDEIVSRHEVLRTAFRTVEGQAVAELINIETIQIEKIEFDLKNNDDGERQARSWVRKHAPELFDLEQGPMLRAYLFNTGPSENFFVLIMHHIISDGWSMGVWMEELSVIYDALESSKAIPLSDLSVQYSDYAIWHKQWLEQVNIETQEEYWKNKLSGKLPVLELPSDFPRPAEANYSGSAEFFSIPADLTEKLKELSKRQETSLYNLMLSTLMVFLNKHSGQNDIIVGVPYANREMVELEKLIGFFLNMLPVRAELSESENFLSLIKKVHKSSFEALANKDVPFERLVKILQPERSLNYHPLFQVMFAFQNFPIPIIEKSGLTFYPSVFDRGATEFDFALYMWEEAGELKGIFEYSLELFKRETISRMREHYLEMIKGLVSDPKTPISKVNILPEEERRQLLVEWNATDSTYPKDKCMHQLFEMQVKKTPEAVAAEFDGNTMTYEELDQRANRVATYLRKKGVGPESFVGICIERSLDMVVGLLGILKAGGAYVPLDPDYPKERLAYMLESSDAKVLITQESLKDEVPKSNAKVICMDTEWGAIESLDESGESASDEVELPSPNNLAYVIFTSGSTGKPKGVQITHRCLVNFLKTMADKPGFTSNDILLAVTTLSFDIAGLELYLPLITGGKISIVSKEVASDGIQLMEKLNTSNANVMQATPSTWRILLAAGWEGDKHLKILCGGEAFPKDLVKELTERAGSVWNMYGPTETTVWSTCYRLIDADHPILIGKPIANTKIYILDNQLQPIPIGAYGELYIGGDSVARGYLNRPDLTEKQFLPDPFSKEPSARMYRTGDLVRYHSDGNIEYVSRLDNQVKVRGFRIELGEIEFFLEQIDNVKECAAVVKEERAGDARIIAFMVFRPGGELTGSEMREKLRKNLPDYMIPNHFVEIEELPLTPAGKINRKQLHESFVFGGVRVDDYVEPQTESEKILARIWEEEIGAERVSANDNFFDIGGHSLLAVKVIARVLKETNVKLTPRDIFLNTLSQIASQYDLMPINDVACKNEKSEGYFTKLLGRFRSK